MELTNVIHHLCEFKNKIEIAQNLFICPV
jgi:hypothetical protein